MKYSKAYILCIVLYFFLWSSLQAEGFTAGTSVKTPGSYQTIHKIRPNDHVLCTTKESMYAPYRVTNVGKKHAPGYLKIYLGNIHIGTALDQLFYLPLEDKWIRAKDLKIGSVLLSETTQLVTVDYIEYIRAEVDLYTITVSGSHTLCVSPLDIKVRSN